MADIKLGNLIPEENNPQKLVVAAAKSVSKNVQTDSYGEVIFYIESKFKSIYIGKVERKTKVTINPDTKRVWVQGHKNFYYKDAKDLTKQLKDVVKKVKQEHQKEFEAGEQRRAGDSLSHDAYR